MEFTYKAYQKLIELLILNHYQIVDYHNYGHAEKPVILRHDVDNCLEKALTMAQIENSLGAKATYFVLLSSDFYNIASYKSLGIINKVINLGHSIALHFDEQKYIGGCDSSILDAIKNEARIMAEIIGRPITSVSMHRPSKETLEANYRIEGIVNSYEKTFFNDFKYVSDSRRFWREDVENHIKSGQYEKLHILTHPFWYNDEEKSIEKSLRSFVNNANYERYSNLGNNIRDLSSIMEIKDVMGIKE